MKSVYFFLLAFLLTIFGNRAVADLSDPMIFYVAATGGNCESCSWIVGDGVIGAQTHEHFIDFLAREELLDARGLRIHLNSPGGNLIGGVLLGKAIRRQQANTAVASAPVAEIYESGLRIVGTPIEAECSSACVFAFAGGVRRYASEKTSGNDVGFQSLGRLGVHQFYDPVTLVDPSAASLSAEDRIGDQQVVALLLSYLSEMGVSAELLQLAAMTDPRNMHYLSEAELRRVRIDTGTDQQVRLSGYRNGLAVAGIEYARGNGNIMLELFCDNDTLHMLASVKWLGSYDVGAHQRWNMMDNISLTDGGLLELISEEFMLRDDGGTSGSFLFRFEDPIGELVNRDRFLFEDWTSRTTHNSATTLSFVLPEDFDGLHVLPNTCL